MRPPNRPIVRRPASATEPPALLLALLAALVLLPPLLLLQGSPATAQTSAADAGTQNGLLLLMDASGSMKEPAGGGTTKIAAAKKALTQVVAGLPSTSRVGLRVYGAGKDHGCDDTQLVAPVAALDRDRLDAAIASFQPRGDTPIGASLKAAAADLKGVPGRKTIVLVSDGEDTCAPPDPCEVARQLSQQGLDLRVESIGFRVDEAARRQLACIAKATGGAYHDAPDARALGAQLDSLSLRAFRGYVAQGSPVTGTPDPAGAPTLAPGAYVDQLAPGESKYYALDVPAGAAPVVNGALIAGATQPLLGQPENFIVVLLDDQGVECTRAAASQTVPSFTASATATGERAQAGGDRCTGTERLVKVERMNSDGDGVNSVELLYSLIGAPDPAAAPAPPVEAGPAGGTTAAPTAVPGGTSYNDAPTIGTGSWSDTIRTSETLYYKVPVGWGQALRVTASFVSQTADQGIAGTQLVAMEVHDALRDNPLNRKLVQPGEDTRQISISTPPVTAPASAEATVAPFKVAGDEYIVLNASSGLGEKKVAASRVRLDVQVVGQQVQGPRLALLAQQATPTPTPSPSTPATADASTPVAAASADAGTSDGPGPLPWVLGAVAAAVVAGVAVGLARRRRGAPRTGEAAGREGS
ncbi:MAG TPA: VWA domain-containing protein [Motilibacteraceae bacterium]|nr:VWA domain-containing protein [Motilibacteraceae bacterium]